MAETPLRGRRGYVDAPTGQIHYRALGEGIPLLLLHQSPSSSWMFVSALPYLAERGIRAIAMDTPGFGMSDVPAPRPSIETYASVVPYLLDALGIEKTAVLGHHTGGLTATEFAVTHPERVTKLIINGVPLYTEEERQARLAGWERRAIPVREDGGHLLERWNRRITVTKGYTDLEAMHRNVLSTLVAGDTEWYGHIAAFEYQMMPRFQSIAVPTMILTNTGEDLYGLSRRAHKVRPDFAFTELQGGTHDIVDEQPEQWADAVVEFLKA